MSSSKKIHLGIVFLVTCCLITACGPSPPADLFHLIPPDFTSASYFNYQYLREDPDLNLPDQATQNLCAALASPEDLDEALGVVLPSTITADSGISISAVGICRGNFDQEAIMEQDLISVLSTQKYQGVQLSIFEFGEIEMASSFLDETTWVLGISEAGVKAVLDMAKSSEPAPHADLGAALSDSFIALMFAHCQYEGCEIRIVLSLEEGPEGSVSAVQLFQFENAEMAAEALPAITADHVEGEIFNQVGSIKISGDSARQEGRFIRVEGTLPLEDVPRLFE